MDFRKARTRTLIQLGGLIEKAGLLRMLGLETGDDLQKDAECFEGASILMGSFVEICQMLEGSEASAHKALWSERGKEMLRKQ